MLFLDPPKHFLDDSKPVLSEVTPEPSSGAIQHTATGAAPHAEHCRETCEPKLFWWARLQKKMSA